MRRLAARAAVCVGGVLFEAARDIAKDANLPITNGVPATEIKLALRRGRVRGQATHSKSLERMLRKRPRVKL